MPAEAAGLRAAAARTGEVYVFPILGGGFGAVQVVAEDLEGRYPKVRLLSLDLDCAEPPGAEEIARSPAVRRTWAGEEGTQDDCVWVDPLPPWWARRVEGLQLPPREVDAANAYGGWMALSLRPHFARLARQGRGLPPWVPNLAPVRVDLGGEAAEMVRSGAHLDLRGLLPAAPEPVRWSGLSVLSHAASLTHEGLDRGLLSALAAFPCGELSWHAPRDAVLDLRGTWPTRVHVQGIDRPLALQLSGATYQLTLSGALDQVTVEAPDLGPQFSLTVRGKTVDALPRNLAGLHVLEVVAQQPFDLSLLPGACPGLTDLRLRVPGVRNTAALRECRQLRTFTAYELYDFAAPDFPGLAERPVWHEVEISGLRATAAKVLRQRLKGLPGLTLSKARSDKWLAENIDNPFRDWDADGAAFGKKAMKLWTTALRQAAAIGAPPSEAQAVEVARALVEGLNRLGGIDTLRREQACEAVQQLVRDHLGGALGSEATEVLIDQWRDF